MASRRYDSGDHVHPNAAGMQMLADAVTVSDLSLRRVMAALNIPVARRRRRN